MRPRSKDCPLTTDAPLIAILDDEPEIRRLLASALEDAGFRTASFARVPQYFTAYALPESLPAPAPISNGSSTKHEFQTS